MQYIDTCLLIPLFVPEPATEMACEYFAATANQNMAISHWTQTEFASAISFKVRGRQMDAPTALGIIHAFQKLAEASFILLPPAQNDFARSQEYLTRFDTGLRAGDALHLAIARNHQATLVTLDRLLLSAATSLGIAAETP